MYDDDADLIEQVSDDEQEAMDTEGDGNRNENKNAHRGNRLSDQVNMDDEPALAGYER